MKNDFYMVLPSNSCPLTRPDNLASIFTVDYETPIRLDGSWQVALTEFSCIYSPLTAKGANRIIYREKVYQKITFMFHIHNNTISKRRDDKDIEIQLTKDGFVQFKYRKPFLVNFFSESDAVFLGMNSEIHNIKAMTQTGLNKMTVSNYPVLSGEIITDEGYMTRNSIIFKEDVLFNTNADFIEYFKDHCSHVFRDMKVDHNAILSFSLKSEINEVEFDEKFRHMFGFIESKIINAKGKIFKGERRIKLRLSFDHMYIYSSVVEPIHVGNYLVPLLKNIWLENKKDIVFGDIVYVAIEQPMYLPVCTNNINKIEINIRDDLGKLISFSPGSKASLTLHFRKNV